MPLNFSWAVLLYYCGLYDTSPQSRCGPFLCKIAYLGLGKLSCIRKYRYIMKEVAATVAHAAVLTKLDYANAAYFEQPTPTPSKHRCSSSMQC